MMSANPGYNWQQDADLVSTAPQFKSFAMYRSGAVVVRTHPSMEHYLAALDESSQAWGRLYCEGLKRGDVAMLTMRVNMLSYCALLAYSKKRGVNSLGLGKVVSYELYAEKVVGQAIEKMKSSYSA